ncbi:MAG: hypothetical protein RL385_3959, partial [Pseudomonadota bacterium]
ADGVRVYDDFAHHPTAVRETLAGLKARHSESRIVAVFEPRSATASRKLHEVAYAEAFDAADEVWLAPVGRKEISDSERLDVAHVASALRARGISAHAPGDHDALLGGLLANLGPGDTAVLMSNGDFGGLHDRLIAQLALRSGNRR